MKKLLLKVKKFEETDIITCSISPLCKQENPGISAQYRGGDDGTYYIF